MNQTKQAAQVTELRQQAVLGNIETLTALISSLGNDAIEQRRRIERLERRATLNADEEQRLQAIANATVIHEHSKRIEQLETCATLNAETIGQVELLKVALVEQGMRIERLEAVLETWLITVDYTAATEPIALTAAEVERAKGVYTTATPPMNEMNVG